MRFEDLFAEGSNPQLVTLLEEASAEFTKHYEQGPNKGSGGRALSAATKALLPSWMRAGGPRLTFSQIMGLISKMNWHLRKAAEAATVALADAEALVDQAVHVNVQTSEVPVGQEVGIHDRPTDRLPKLVVNDDDEDVEF